MFSKEQLAYEVFGPDAKGSDALVEESVSLLKSKLDGLSSKWSIRLIWGVGYKFEVNEFIIGKLLNYSNSFSNSATHS